METKKILKIIQNIVTVLIVIIGLFLIITLFPIKNNYQVKVVLSGSMEPTIHTGSIVIIKPVSQYKIGDVVIFGKDTKKNIPTTHRIVSSRVIDGVLLFTTKGDANKSPDHLEIQQSDIHGKKLFSVPYVGYVIDFVHKPFGMIIVIIIPAVFIIYDEIKKITKEVKKIKNEKNNQ
ncbi:MAG: signal peptidase I [Candidatus Paceibacterota bacterium]